MDIIDLNPIISNVINSLLLLSDEDIRDQMRIYNLSINDTKYFQAFSAYGLTRLLSGLKQEYLKGGLLSIPDYELERIRWVGVFVFRAYTTFVYMRSDTLERNLDRVPLDSALRPFRDFFRKGSKDEGGDTIAQHIRNSLSHGTFSISDDMQTVLFSDENPYKSNDAWQGQMMAKDFTEGLCAQIFRFYYLAFQVHKENAKIS